jgi:hypothetical protein
MPGRLKISPTLYLGVLEQAQLKKERKDIKRRY